MALHVASRVPRAAAPGPGAAQGVHARRTEVGHAAVEARYPFRALALVIISGLLALVGPATAFRNVRVGVRAPALTLDAGSGRFLSVPVPGRPTVILFWRAGQQFSEEALADLAALHPTLAAKGVAVVAIAEPGAAVRAAPALSFETVIDRDRRAAETWGLIVFPSTAVVDAAGVLRAYLPSRHSNYRVLVESHALRALGEISDAELATRLARVGEVHGPSAAAAQAALKRGVALAKEARWEEAARELGQALARWPDLLDAHLQLGYVLLKLGEPARALAEFEYVLARNPTSPGARVGVGIAYLRLGRVDEGIQRLEEAVVLNPEPVRAHYELGRAYEGRGDLARAAQHYRWALLKLAQGRK